MWGARDESGFIYAGEQGFAENLVALNDWQLVKWDGKGWVAVGDD
jgi:hypothetical protein